MKQCALGYYTPGHEVGHNFGAAHDAINVSMEEENEEWLKVLHAECLNVMFRATTVTTLMGMGNTLASRTGWATELSWPTPPDPRG